MFQPGLLCRYYWYNTALEASSDIAVAGVFNWRMLLCLMAAWVIIYLCLFKGIQSSGKVSCQWDNHIFCLHVQCTRTRTVALELMPISMCCTCGSPGIHNIHSNTVLFLQCTVWCTIQCKPLDLWCYYYIFYKQNLASFGSMYMCKCMHAWWLYTKKCYICM